MITFLPYPDFMECARVLDNKRLGKQRAETLQLLIGIYFNELKHDRQLALQVVPDQNIFYKDKYSVVNHPACKMWADYPVMLMCYCDYICREWIIRGFADYVHEKITILCKTLTGSIVLNQQSITTLYPTVVPPWLGDERLHRSHRSNLTRKFPEHYSQFWNEPDNLPYYWPES